MNMRKISVLITGATLALGGIAGETHQGDITAAVRAAGGSVTVTSTQGAAAGSVDVLANGKWKSERYLTSEKTGPLSLGFTFGAAFLPGEDIVVTGLTFTVGGNGSNLWGSWADRMPKAFSLSGSNDDGVTWAPIVSVGSFTDYAESSHPTELHTYSGSVSFANWTSYRKYKIDITEATGSSDYFIQLSEVAFLGFYGGTVVQPEPVRVDLTAGARAAKAQTIESNAGEAGATYSVDKMVDGLYGYNNNRYLSNQETTKALWDAGQPVTIDYTIGEAYARGADVIVTAYTIDVDQKHGYALARLPKDWELQGWDGAAWQTIDRMVGFADWQEVMHANEADGQEYKHYSYTFSITNSVSYRKYRLSVSKVNDRASSGDYFQLTEFQLWGYADATIEGKVGLTATPHDLHITTDAFKGYFSPVLTISDYDKTEGLYAGTVANLFDGNYKNYLLARIGVDGDEDAYSPLVIGYEIPQTYLTGKDVVLKRYSLFSRTDGISQYDKRAPKSWTLQGLADDGRWIKIDRQRNFTDWQAVEGQYFANFSLTDNNLSFRSYRLVISEVAGTSSYQSRENMQQVLIFEIELDGQWGMGIAGDVPERQGLLLLFR